MISTLKLASLAAALSAGLVTGFDRPASSPSPLKDQHRLGEAAPARTVGTPIVVTTTARADRLDAGCRAAGAEECRPFALVASSGGPIELRDAVGASSSHAVVR